MPSINAHFDGHAFVPDEPLSLAIPIDRIIRLTWEIPEIDLELKPGRFADLAKYAQDFPDLPPDLSVNHDRYVLGED